MRSLVLGATVTILAGHALAKDVRETPPVEIEYRFSKSVIPPSCEDQAAEAEVQFNTKWVTQLSSSSSETILVESSEDPVGKDRRYLAPVNSEVVFYEQRQLSGQFASLFIDCEKRQAYVLARGGIRDVSTWHGPFKF